MIVSDVIARLRSILNDNAANDADRRWPDAKLWPYVDAAQKAILYARSDFRLSATNTFNTPSAVTGTGSALMVPNEDKEAMASFAAHLILTDDNSDSNNAAQAAEYLKRYERLMIATK